MVECFYEVCFNSEAGLVGVSEHQYDQLSVEWVQRCADVLARHDGAPQFRATMGPPLEHIEIELTASDGVGHGEFHANGELAGTAVFLRHSSIPTAWEHTNILESLELVLWWGLISNQAVDDFREIPLPSLSLVSRRPLFSIVTSSRTGISETDLHRVKSLALNFAGAYLLRYAG